MTKVTILIVITYMIDVVATSAYDPMSWIYLLQLHNAMNDEDRVLAIYDREMMEGALCDVNADINIAVRYQMTGRYDLALNEYEECSKQLQSSTLNIDDAEGVKDGYVRMWDNEVILCAKRLGDWRVVQHAVGTNTLFDESNRRHLIDYMQRYE